jgi:hypothetical protein
MSRNSSSWTCRRIRAISSVGWSRVSATARAPVMPGSPSSIVSGHLEAGRDVGGQRPVGLGVDLRAGLRHHRQVVFGSVAAHDPAPCTGGVQPGLSAAVVAARSAAAAAFAVFEFFPVTWPRIRVSARM